MIVLDSHTYLWAVLNDGQLSRKARTAIDNESERVVSAMTVYELAFAIARGRIDVGSDPNWVERSLHRAGVVVEPVSAAIARAAARLKEPMHGDPADRIIVATALELGAALVTRDERIRRNKLVETIW